MNEELFNIPGFNPAQRNNLIIFPPNTCNSKERLELAFQSIPASFTSPSSSLLLSPPTEIETPPENSSINSFADQDMEISSVYMSPVSPDPYDYDLPIGASASPEEDTKDNVQFFAESSDSPNSTNELNNVAGDFIEPNPTPIHVAALPDFRGLINQAATCYLNSLIQILFMTPEFRNGFYRLQFDSRLETLPFELQRLFLKLQYSPNASVETRDLTKSFGWDSSEATKQHDIEELCHVMFEALDKSKTTQELIKKLYEGKMNNIVKCLECNTENAKVEPFLDVALPILLPDSTNAYESLEEALKGYVKPEILSDNNKYFCEKCKMECDAHKVSKFKELPYILTINLKRFSYDKVSYTRKKLNDR